MELTLVKILRFVEVVLMANKLFTLKVVVVLMQMVVLVVVRGSLLLLVELHQL